MSGRWYRVLLLPAYLLVAAYVVGLIYDIASAATSSEGLRTLPHQSESQIQAPPGCDAPDRVLERLAAAGYSLQGTGEGRMGAVALYVNPGTDAWAVLQFGSDFGCMIVGGQHWSHQP